MRKDEEARPVSSVRLPVSLLGLLMVALIGLFSCSKTEPTEANGSPTPTPTPTLAELAANELRQLTEGRIAFNPPTTMQQGQEERIEARISSEDIGAKLTEGLKGRGLPDVQNVKVGSLMKVLLYSEESEFQITKLSSEEQVVSGRPFAQWDWTVTPLDYGEHSLHLMATAKVVIERLGEKSVDVPVIDRKINVKVSPAYIVKRMVRTPSTWQIVFGSGTGIVVISAIFAAIRKRRIKKKTTTAGFVTPKNQK